MVNLGDKYINANVQKELLEFWILDGKKSYTIFR